MPTDKVPFQGMKAITKCSIHTENNTELLCVDHDQFICSLCLVRFHRNCQIIDDLFKDQLQTQHDNGEALQTLEESLNELQHKCENYLTHVASIEREIKHECRKFVREVKKCVYKINDSITSRYYTVLDKEGYDTSVEISRFENVLKCIYNNLALLTVTLSFGHPSEQTVIKKVVNEALIEAQ
ncbi:hypothetical protein DPMN_152499 [Dreissena polymorpha]|uniref:B box-type domain-containing protein n=1 Tax=Dreissena polymorpha TaxID=45954 RepID=A0A9D4FLD5_DREPO|nr:hypothetical protein DPMN_152499 [Dreissena polymorpha]